VKIVSEVEKLHRDVQCAKDVGMMAKLRRFDQEITVYGTAEWLKDGSIRYLVSSKVESLYQYQMEKLPRGSYFTPVILYKKRTPAPAGMEEILNRATKYTLLGHIKRTYEQEGYFEKMQHFFQMPPNNNSYTILQNIQERIEGYYNERDLQWFWGLLQSALAAKILLEDSYIEFADWYLDVCRQMENNPIQSNKYNRTFYGFIYTTDCFEDVLGISRDNVKYDCFCDAKKAKVLEERGRKIIQGHIVGPIIEKTYYFQEFSDLKKIRQNYRTWLLSDLDKLSKWLWDLKLVPGVIDKMALKEVRDRFISNREAKQAVQYYEVVWNKKYSD